MLKNMVTEITNDIRISVVTEYQNEYSNPVSNHYVFAYRISIENKSRFTVQLLNRHWFIFDSDGTKREVEGEGIVGQQPILEPNEVHQYVSGCNLRTSIGKMNGYYTFERMHDGEIFTVNIPEFVMITPFKLN